MSWHWVKQTGSLNSTGIVELFPHIILIGCTGVNIHQQLLIAREYWSGERWEGLLYWQAGDLSLSQLLTHYLYFWFISSLINTPLLKSEVAKKPGINNQCYPELSSPEPPPRGPCGYSGSECPRLKVPGLPPSCKGMMQSWLKTKILGENQAVLIMMVT